MATTYIGVDVSKKTLSIYIPATNKALLLCLAPLINTILPYLN
ncbi:hypothetical protein [Candidatus Tisiphia endosymbiont of Ditula angustiorana]